MYESDRERGKRLSRGLDDMPKSLEEFVQLLHEQYGDLEPADLASLDQLASTYNHAMKEVFGFEPTPEQMFAVLAFCSWQQTTVFHNFEHEEKEHHTELTEEVMDEIAAGSSKMCCDAAFQYAHERWTRK